jgi:hypothetical protein
MFDTSVPSHNSSLDVEGLVNQLRLLEADAARYRWLRGQEFDFIELENLNGEELDRVIDARRQDCSTTILTDLFLGVPVGEVDELVARLHSLEADAVCYRWLRGGSK